MLEEPDEMPARVGVPGFDVRDGVDGGGGKGPRRHHARCRGLSERGRRQLRDLLSGYASDRGMARTGSDAGEEGR